MVDSGESYCPRADLLDYIKTWRSQLPINDTISSEEILTKIIKTLETFLISSDLLELQVAALKAELEAEVQKRKKLEMQVDVLSSEVVELRSTVAQLTARDTDLKTLNYLMDVFGLLKNFIMRYEMSTGSYSSAFKKLNDKDVIDSLFVEPIDNIFDSHDEKNRKTFLLTHTAEAHLLFQNLALDPQLVFDLNKKVREQNLSTHNLDNKLYKNAKYYVQDKLSEFLTVMDDLTSQNELSPEKDSIADLVHTMKTLHNMAILNKTIWSLLVPKGI